MRNWTFIILVLILYALTPYFIIRLLDNGVSLKYEVFEPTESHHYRTLKTQEDKIDYIEKVEQHTEKLFRKEVLFKTLIALTFLSATGLLIFRKRLLKSKQT